MSQRRALTRSLGFALEGIADALRTQPNMRLLALFAVLTFLAASFLRVQLIELLLLCAAISVLLFAEMINSAMEMLADHPPKGVFFPHIKRAKDMAAGAVLITAFNALIIVAALLIPRICKLLASLTQRG